MAMQLPPLPEVEQLSPRVIRILGGNPGKFTLQGTNTYLVGTGRSRILVDTAAGLPSWTASLSNILSASHSTISTVVLTHWHDDHTGGIADVRRLAPGVRVCKMPLSASSLTSSDSASSDAAQAAEAAIPGAVHPLADGDVLRAEGATLRVVATPGHTADHIALVLEEEDGGALFTGDAVLGHGTAVFEDLAAYISSLQRMASLVRSGRAYPGHGAVIADAKGKILEYLEHRAQREEEIVGVLRAEEGCTPGKVVSVVYRDVPKALHPAAERGVGLVLKKLESEGRVKRDGEVWMLVERSKAAL